MDRNKKKLGCVDVMVVVWHLCWTVTSSQPGEYPNLSILNTGAQLVSEYSGRVFECER